MEAPLSSVKSQAFQKKQLIAEGKLDKYGKPNEKTPADWLDYAPVRQSEKNGGGLQIKQEVIDDNEPSTPATDGQRKRRHSATPHSEDQDVSPTQMSIEKKKKKKKKKKQDDEEAPEGIQVTIKEEPVDYEAEGHEEPVKEKKKKKKKDKHKEKEAEES